MAAYEWLLANKYQLILVHPEQLPPTTNLEEGLPGLIKLGVWRQGNFRSFTREESLHADQRIRMLMQQDPYQLLSLDMLRRESLESRPDGLRLMADEFGAAALNRLTIVNPRRLIFDIPDSAEIESSTAA